VSKECNILMVSESIDAQSTLHSYSTTNHFFLELLLIKYYLFVKLLGLGGRFFTTFFPLFKRCCMSSLAPEWMLTGE